MEIRGYKKNKSKTFLIYLCYLLTGGLLRLFFHWYPRLRLISTHEVCRLTEAEKILIIEDYKGKWKSYFVEEIKSLRSYDYDLTYYLSNGSKKENRDAKIFDCKRTRYVFHDEEQGFLKLCGLETGIARSAFHTLIPLRVQDQISRSVIYGANEIDVPLDSVFSLFVLEALTPFYIFQVFSLIVWLAEEYYYYGIAIVLMSVIGIGSSVIQTRKNQSRLRGTLHMTDTVSILKNGFYYDVPTTELVPGDMIVVPPHGCTMHCDATLLNGSCVVNESMLTGESVPVVKTSLPNTSETFSIKNDEDHVLYCGTQVIQTRQLGDSPVLAVVLRTGFLTCKGQLVRSIMYPPPADFKFDQDSYKYILILAAISVIGVIYTVISKSTRNIAVTDIIIKALDTITIVLPPALPAAMTVGKLFALNRLKKKDIFCMNSRVINVSGSINCVCFDKTGTLTEDGLDMWGVVPIENGKFLSPMKDITNLSNSSPLLQGMASCQSLALIKNKLEGDPLDTKMFESTGWVLEQPKKMIALGHQIHTVLKPAFGDVQIKLIHQNQFSSKLQRMSVVGLIDDEFVLFCKGSPEMVASLCDFNTIPENLSSKLKSYTVQGYRVIAMAFKHLPSMSCEELQQMKRDQFECDMTFLGLIVLENKLKPETADIISVLRNADIKVVMITGDNMQTALSVAKECGICELGTTVVDVEVIAPAKNEEYKLRLTSDQINVSQEMCILNMEENRKIQFAITGNNWKLIREHFPNHVASFISNGIVFARMSSDQKQQLIEELQNLGYYVSMCGDGTNDCGALKAAHVGISLSDAESSVASPFTSKNANISCVPEIIKQGRAALVTSFGIFKFMVAYSMTEFLSVIILYGIDSNLTSIQFLYIDVCIILVLSAVFGNTGAYEKGLWNVPPMTSLLSAIPLISLILQVLNVVAFQVAAYHLIQTYDWFEPFDFIPNTNIYTSYENYAVFATSAFQYITLAVVFSKGSPYRKPIYTNYWFSLSLILVTSLCIYIIYDPAQWMLTLFEMKIPPESDGKMMVLLLAVAHFFSAYVIEDFLCDYILGKKLKLRDSGKVKVVNGIDNVAYIN